ncbi:PulJ/GspJ family protein [Flavobacterium poyangense]|uniref:PulJ/GspJ family protein n=1 Tax=Flavobacterium poyangense TaxID=2204302 RepID=UPI001423DCAD|nr:prepilin-type N-terminal cleavage/methylation domain-containing protein [Flavobacterium sp. JXAS1]
MGTGKIKSFTLSELLIVMIITAIVVGMAFSVLRLVQKQIHTIQTNFDKSSTLALFEQKLWQDFNEPHAITGNKQKQFVVMLSETDTVTYSFHEHYTLRNKDTIPLKLTLQKLLFSGKEIQDGDIDAIQISAATTLPDYEIFVSKKNDITFFMNREDGL